MDYYAKSVRGYSLFFSSQIFMGGGLDRMRNVPVRYHFRTKPKYTMFVIRQLRLLLKLFTIFSDGCLGSNDDEGRSEVR